MKFFWHGISEEENFAHISICNQINRNGRFGTNKSRFLAINLSDRMFADVFAMFCRLCVWVCVCVCFLCAYVSVSVRVFVCVCIFTLLCAGMEPFAQIFLN